MTETQIELSGSCCFTLTTYEYSDRKDMSLDYTEHSTDHWNSDTETSIDIDTNRAREIVAFMYKSFPEIAQRKPLTPEWIFMWLRNWCDRHPLLRQETYNSLYKMVSDARAIEAAHNIK